MTPPPPLSNTLYTWPYSKALCSWGLNVLRGKSRHCCSGWSSLVIQSPVKEVVLHLPEGHLRHISYIIVHTVWRSGRVAGETRADGALTTCCNGRESCMQNSTRGPTDTVHWQIGCISSKRKCSCSHSKVTITGPEIAADARVWNHIAVHCSITQAYLIYSSSVAAGAQSGIEECKHQFAWDRWNCPERALQLSTHSSLRSGKSRVPTGRLNTNISTHLLGWDLSSKWQTWWIFQRRSKSVTQLCAFVCFRFICFREFYPPPLCHA